MPSRIPAGLRSRGRRLWRETLASCSLTPAHLVLLEEACRTADRLDVLNRMLADAGVDDNGSGEVAFADIGPLLAESRQQQAAFKAVLAELRQGQAGSAPTRTGKEVGDGVSDLSARIAKRRKEASG